MFRCTKPNAKQDNIEIQEIQIPANCILWERKFFYEQIIENCQHIQHMAIYSMLQVGALVAFIL